MILGLKKLDADVVFSAFLAGDKNVVGVLT